MKIIKREVGTSHAYVYRLVCVSADELREDSIAGRCFIGSIVDEYGEYCELGTIKELKDKLTRLDKYEKK